MATDYKMPRTVRLMHAKATFDAAMQSIKRMGFIVDVDACELHTIEPKFLDSSDGCHDPADAAAWLRNEAKGIDESILRRQR